MHIVIIGNGISGITAARHIRKLSNHKITVISSESEYFFSRTALMYVYMGHMRFEDIQPYEPWFWKKNRIDLLKARVSAIHHKENEIVLADGVKLQYDRLILATGSVTATYHWPGQDLKGVQGLYSYQDLQLMEESTRGIKRAVIVGGGLIGIEMAEMLHSRGIHITMLVRENNYCEGFLPLEESQMVNREIRRHGIDLKLETELSEIVGNERGYVQSVITSKGEHIESDFAGLTTGVKPNINLVHSSEIEYNKGILVNDYLQTNIPNIYAIGDCAEIRSPLPGRNSIEPLWYAGRMMGETVAYNVCGDAIPYEPGIWFNSAKFFDIEWQVYGNVSSQLNDELYSLYWKHPDGKKSMRIQFRKSDEAVVGFMLMGIRYRQEVCEKWIALSTPVVEVLSQLSLANFDPEFSKEYEGEIITEYNRQYGGLVRQNGRRSADRAIKFTSGRT